MRWREASVMQRGDYAALVMIFLGYCVLIGAVMLLIGAQ
jgi:hypothetical protein